jgi:aldose sugar dehydrogenase
MHHNNQSILLLLSFFIVISFIIAILLLNQSILNVYAQSKELQNIGDITINDPNLKVELVTDEVIAPTSMAFLGPNDFLILGKDGTVNRVTDGQMLQEPLLQLNTIDSKDERGMLGIDILKQNGNSGASGSSSTIPTYVFLYYTEGGGTGQNGEGGGGGTSSSSSSSQSTAIRNHLYRYELVNNKLINPRLLLDLPGNPGPAHQGGKVSIGPDNNVYVSIGDERPSAFSEAEGKTKAQNYADAVDPDGRAGILRVTLDGQVVNGKGILGDQDPLNKYYAYGIRNSFGIGFDPVTGNLWDTENGPDCCDEINLVQPGFNSGWAQVLGAWIVADPNSFPLTKGEQLAPPNPQGLVNFGGKGKYHTPEFIWSNSVAPTAVLFFNSDKLGNQYQNDLFVGSAKDTIFDFDLNKDRKALLLNGTLSDKISDSDTDLEDITFAKGFGIITDLKTGPDGYLYVVTGVKEDHGTIYRIVPASSSTTTS